MLFASPANRDFEALADDCSVDVALDTYPSAGTTTTCDALFMGVPVVTLVGATPASRPGRSLLHRVGLDENVTTSVEAYVARAVDALRERGGVDRAALRERFLTGELGDARGLSFALAALFRREIASVEATSR